jgi:ABC-2 type transport system ATP-binding protein
MPVVVLVTGVDKRYGDVVALNGVDLEVHQGEIFGILGLNGAGKTTLVECIEGLRRPDRGGIAVLGLDPQQGGDRLREQLGVQLQDARVPGKLRVLEALRLYRSFYRDGENPDHLLHALGLADKRSAFVEDLSGGQQQRLSAALALIGAPRLAILDEITAGLDPSARREVWGLIREIRDRGVTILLVTHFMDEAERLCDRLVVLHHGRVVAADTPAGLIARHRGEQRIRFRTIDDAPEIDSVAALPEVSTVEQLRDGYLVTGGDGVLQALMSHLTDLGATATDLRVEQATLEDAFVTITSTTPTSVTGGSR